MSSLPKTYKKIVVVELGTDFKKVTKVIEVPMVKPDPGQVLVKNRFLGVNASDVNFSAGRYGTGVNFPIDCGFEGLGEVVAVGKNTDVAVGTPVIYSSFGAYSEYKVLPADKIVKLSKIAPEYIPCQVSAATAAISLDKMGELKSGETVLVTAAAGGTGQFAVQWAKQAGCHVIGTCSTPEKADLLKKLGCDRPVNYKKENLGEVLKKEYPDGVDVVYESIGGDMFETCFNNLKTKGRLIIIGYISKYVTTDTSSQDMSVLSSLPQKLLTKSLSVRGFFLMQYLPEMISYTAKIAEMYDKGKIQCLVDNGKNSPKGPFVGLDQIQDAIEYLYSGKSSGKIIVEIK